MGQSCLLIPLHCTLSIDNNNYCYISQFIVTMFSVLHVGEWSLFGFQIDTVTTILFVIGCSKKLLGDTIWPLET